MANQIYRGNSEQKLYNLTNNFVGGMNTVSVDEVTPEYQFRQLLNVDLREYGKLQNRKGFKLISIFTDYIFNKAPNAQEILTLLYGDILHFSVLNDTNNLLDTLVKYDNLAKFQQDFINTPFNFNLLLIAKQSNPQGVKFYNLNLRNEQGTVNPFKAELNDLQLFVSGVPKTINLTGLKVAKVANLSYIVTSEMVEGGNQIVEINSRDAMPKVRVIDKQQNYYETSPYDIEDEGYNLLAKNPILNVKQDGSIQNIRGVTLVKRTGTSYYPLENIPTDGQFTALVMHTGVIPVANIKERIYYYNTLGVLVELERDKDYLMTYNDTLLADGILLFDFDVAKIERRDVPIHIEFNVVNDADIVTYQTFEDLDALNDYCNFTISTKNDDTIGAVVPYFYDNNMAPTNYHLWEKTKPYIYENLGRLYTTPQAPTTIGDFTYYLADGFVKKYYGTIFARRTYTDWNGVDYLRYNGTKWTITTEALYNTGTFKLQFLDDFDVTIPNYPENTTTGVINFLKEITQIPNLPKRIPSNIVGVVMAGTTPYVWKDTFTGDETDFAAYVATDDATSNFTLVTQFGNNVLEPLVSLDLSDVKLATINEHLVLYKGNTLWFSVYGNPNYFPYKNYVNLPLIGNDEIVSINYFRGSHIVFTKERIYRISGYFPDISITLINDSIGCVAERSIKSFNNTLVFLTYDGLYRLKQNYYMDGLENVEKIDKNITNIYPKQASAEAFIYSSMYHLVFKDNSDFDTLKYYYDIDLPYGEHPYTIDKYAIKPKLIMQDGSHLFSLNNGELYLYDEGYTDFLPNEVAYTSEDVQKSTYHVTVRTTNMMLGLPTHSKKFKNLIIKTKADIPMPLYITVLIDDYIHSTPMQYIATLTEDGQIEYREILGRTDVTTTGEQTSNLLLGDAVELIDENQVLGNFTLGNSKLGVNNTNTHKMNISGKGQYVQFLVDQFTPSEFSILDIGLQYKIGKVRGD